MLLLRRMAFGAQPMSKLPKMPKDLAPIGEDIVRWTAEIIGPQSAAQKALNDAQRRKEEGGNPVFLYSWKEASIFVMDFGCLDV